MNNHNITVITQSDLEQLATGEHDEIAKEWEVWLDPIFPEIMSRDKLARVCPAIYGALEGWQDRILIMPADEEF